MDKLKLAHDYFMKHVNVDQYKRVDDEELISWSFDYVDAMQAEAEKRNKAEAAQKRKEIREMLNAPNIFVEREGQHFDDVEEWQPDWSQAPAWANWWAMDEDKNTRWIYSEFDQPYISDMFSRWCAIGRFDSEDAPSFGYTGNWQDSLRKRPQ